MKVCYFGTYESKFPRTKTIIAGLRKKGVEVIECHEPFWELTREKVVNLHIKAGLKLFIDLFFIYLKLIKKFFNLDKFDVIFVGYNGYFDMPLAKILATLGRVPLVYTPVFPLYETTVLDRGFINRNSLKSRLIHSIDTFACRLADVIILETDEYINYYMKEFGVSKEKFVRIPLGADEDNFRPQGFKRDGENRFNILFYGKFIPLQGIPYIIKAAKLLESYPDIYFKVIGSGQLSKEIRELSKNLQLKNISFIEWVKYEELPEHIANTDVCLGIFGDTEKAKRGIPIKAFEALALGKPLITGDSPAAKEVFLDKENTILCKIANAEALATSILLLKRDIKLRKKIAEAGKKLYRDKLSIDYIGKVMKVALTETINSQQRLTRKLQKEQQLKDVFVSVIIPAFNAEKTIMECLDSLVKQDTDLNYEIIVVNSSNDRTCEIVKEHFPTVHCIQLEKRVFAGTARNIGIKKARGDIFAFIDSDCTASVEWLNNIVALHREGHRAISGSIVNECNGNVFSKAEYPLEVLEFSPNNPRREVKFASAANCSFLRNVFERHGLFPDIHRGEDVMFCYKIREKGEKIIFAPVIKISHKNNINFNSFIKKQIKHGEYSYKSRQMAKLSGSFMNNPLILPFMLPVLPFVRALRVIYRSFCLKNKIIYDILSTFPLFLLGCAMWSLGYATGYSNETLGRLGMSKLYKKRAH